MKCLLCNHENTKVIDSRIGSDGFSIRRRRECEKCEFRFSTTEENDILDLTVLKRNGNRELYDRNKIETGLKRALEKRPHSAEKFQALVQKIEHDIQRKRKSEVTSEEIGDIVIRHLRSFDRVAYVRFASVYESCQDLDGFAEILDGLRSRSRRPVATRSRSPGT